MSFTFATACVKASTTSILINSDLSVSLETKILKISLNYHIGQLSEFLFLLDRRQVPFIFHSVHFCPRNLNKFVNHALTPLPLHKIETIADSDLLVLFMQ